MATLAIGIACSSSMYSVLAGVVLKPLPWPDSDRLAVIWNRPPEAADPLQLSQQEILDLRELLPGMVLASYNINSRPVRLAPEEVPQIASVTGATRELFEVLGAQVATGRLLEANEYVQGGPRAVIASHEFWQGRLGGASDAVGRSVWIGDFDYTVVGIMPREFPLPLDYAEGGRTELWIGTELAYAAEWPREVRMFPTMVKLPEGISVRQARADLDRALERMREQFPRQYSAGWRMELVPVSEELLGRARPAMLALFGAVLLVLLIACANVANLLLAQGDGRRAEFALRAALGANRLRLVRQLLFESVALALAGGVVGTALAWLIVQGLPKLRAGTLPRFDTVAIDGGVLAFALLVSLAAAVLFGLMPAVRLASGSERAALAGSRATTDTLVGGVGSRGRGGPRSGLRRLLVVAQIALATVLIAGAGLLYQSLRQVINADLGFEPERLQVAVVSAPSFPVSDSGSDSGTDSDSGPNSGSDRLLQFWDQLRARTLEQGDIEAASVTMNVPFTSGVLSRAVEIERASSPIELPRVTLERAGPDVVEAMGYRLVAGRGLEERDRNGALPVVLVNRRLADLIGPDTVGSRLRVQDNPAAWMTIVGVVADVVGESIDTPIAPRAVLPYTQFDDVGRRMQSTMTLALRRSADEPLATEAVRELVHSVDAGATVFSVSEASVIVNQQGLAQHRFAAFVLGLFAAVAILLAVVGVYGLLSYLVDGSRRSLGIRLALGATGAQITRSVQLGALALAVGGIVVGVPAGFALTRALDSLLYEVSASDVRVFLASAILLIGATLLAATVPARRAANTAPTEVLRSE